jgi:hypothetical protein
LESPPHHATPVTRRVGAGFELLSAALIGAALVALYSGPLRLDLFGVGLSVRTLSRPLIMAAVFIAARLWLQRGPSFAAAALGTLARTFSTALVAAGILGWFVHLSPTCGGSDSYGYVSAAERLLDGKLIADEPLAPVLPFPYAIVAATPLGYAPAGRRPNASVPVYPLGLPMLMAAGAALFGPSAVFYVPPVLGIILLIAGCLVAREWYQDRYVTVLACALLALHPLVFTYSLQPMSDVPATAMLMIGVYGISRLPPRPVIGGLAAALALMIRPAVAPAALALAIVPIVTLGRRGVRAAAAYAACVVAGSMLQAWTQWYLYGNAFMSGHGVVSSLFSLATFSVNLQSYAHWGLLTMGPVWLAGLAVGLISSDRRALLVLLILAAGIGGPYLFYFPYDHWETLRFLLPVVAVATIISAWGLLVVARRLAGEAGGALIAAIVAAAVGASWMAWLSANHVFEMPEHEARHRVVGEIVARTTADDAVILALQHSGSLRYYARRETINWDQIPPGAFRPTVQALHALGRDIFVMIDSAEERAMFLARHGEVLEEDGWLPAGQWRNVQLFEAPLSPSPRP